MSGGYSLFWPEKKKTWRRYHSNSGELFQQPGGTIRTGKRGENERRRWAFYRNQRLRNWCCETSELKRRTPAVSARSWAWSPAVEDEADVWAPHVSGRGRESRAGCALGCCWLRARTLGAGLGPFGSLLFFFTVFLFCFLDFK